MYEQIEKLESRYVSQMEKVRLLASTWLLATLGGILFLFVRGSNIMLFNAESGALWDKALIASLIAFSGASGISFLWVLEGRVFRGLLAATWLFAMRLETQCEGLMGFRQSITQYSNIKSHGTSWVVGLYYQSQVFFLLVLSALFFAWHVYSATSVSSAWNAGLSFLAGFLFAILVVGRLRRFCNGANWRSIAKANPRWPEDLRGELLKGGELLRGKDD